MAVQIDIAYQGTLRCQATHAPSGNTFVTDAPVDNQGKGESFSPTDLVATALGTCMLTTMGIVAQRQNLDLTGATVTVLKEMTPPPRRIATLACKLQIPLEENHPLRETLERAALACPVYLSLHPEVAKPTAFLWRPAAT